MTAHEKLQACLDELDKYSEVPPDDSRIMVEPVGNNCVFELNTRYGDVFTLADLRAVASQIND